jgi:histidine triad (HIT) family protein
MTEKEKATNCVFCKIVSGEKKETFLYEDDEITAFNDINPRAPIHILITPRTHYHDFSEMMEKEPELLVKVGKVIEKLVDQLKIRGKWYTWGFHCGGKQSVNHAHAQLLAGMKDDELVL